MPFTSQPQCNTSILGGPLTQNIVSVTVPSLNWDVVRNTRTILGTNCTKIPSSNGMSWKGAASDCPVDFGVTGGLSTLIPTTDPVSWFGRILVTTLNTRQVVFSDNNVGGTMESVVLEIIAANQWRLATVNTVPTSVDVISGNVTLGWHDVEIEITGNNFTNSLYVDGQLIGTPGSSGSPRRAGANLRLMQPGLFTGVTFLGQLVLSVFWNRNRSDAERAAFRQNPWQIFKAASKPKRVGFSTGTSYSYTATGGFTLAGSSNLIRQYIRSGTGGVLFSGAATIVPGTGTKSQTVTPTGGLTYSGVATQSRSKVTTTPSGGLIFAGNATIVEFPDPTPQTVRAFKRCRRPRTRKY